MRSQPLRSFFTRRQAPRSTSIPGERRVRWTTWAGYGGTAAVLISASALLSAQGPMESAAVETVDKGPAAQAAAAVPLHLPEPDADGVIYLTDASGGRHATTLDPALTASLSKFLQDAHAPIAAVLVAEARTGRVLAIAQGRAPEAWGGKTHTALHAGFPAASLFKTVVATAAFEIADVDGAAPVGLTGGCSQVRETGDWLAERDPDHSTAMSLKRAYGLSCNGYFAKIAVGELGMGVITEFARRFGWETGIASDFPVERSPFRPPSPQSSSTSTIGRFAAGFGQVGLSTAHAASMMLAIAGKGVSVPLLLWADTPAAEGAANGAAEGTENGTTEGAPQRLFQASTAERLKAVMAETVKRGTAAFAFRRGKYRALREIAGGKTGTLTGASPKGLTTWFAGMVPLEEPEIVVAAVAMLEDRWVVKAPNIAAEAMRAYYDLKLGGAKAALNTARGPAAAAQTDGAPVGEK
jgi:cell division protein FtsI/penicillin-binding protein 2